MNYDRRCNYKNRVNSADYANCLMKSDTGRDSGNEITQPPHSDWKNAKTDDEGNRAGADRQFGKNGNDPSTRTACN